MLDDPTTALWLIHLGATFAMVGVIWMVQICHYPLFADVGEDAFQHYHRRHTTTISWIVVPLMLAEVATGALLLSSAAASVGLWVSAGLVVVAWATTFLLSVPCHDTLARGFDRGAIRRLVVTNWLRTLAWTARGALVLLLTPAALASV